MSRFQPEYNQSKKKEVREMVPQIDKEIRELKSTRSSETNNDMRKAIDAKIKSLEIKKKSYRVGDPVKESNVEEEAQGAVTTGSIGSPTMSLGDGGTSNAVYGSSHIYAPKVGPMMSRKGDIKCKCKKNKKKKNFSQHYFDSENMGSVN